MFPKSKKLKYYSKIERKNDFSFSSSSGDRKYTSDEIVEAMRNLYERDGKVVIDFIDDEEIRVTSVETVIDREVERKLNEIKEMVKEKLLSN